MLQAKVEHKCKTPPLNDPGPRLRFICPECEAVWETYTMLPYVRVENYGFLGLRQRVIEVNRDQRQWVLRKSGIEVWEDVETC